MTPWTAAEEDIAVALYREGKKHKIIARDMADMGLPERSPQAIIGRLGVLRQRGVDLPYHSAKKATRTAKKNKDDGWPEVTGVPLNYQWKRFESYTLDHLDRRIG